MARWIDESNNLSVYVSIKRTKILHGKRSEGKHTYAQLYVAATMKCEFYVVIEAVKESTS